VMLGANPKINNGAICSVVRPFFCKTNQCLKAKATQGFDELTNLSRL